MQVDTRVKNNGTDPTHIIVRVENPKGVYIYHVTEGWEEVDPGVFYGGILAAGQMSSRVFDGTR